MKMKRLCACLVLLGLGQPTFAASPTSPTNDWVYLDNGQVRLGIKRSSGGGIAHFSASSTRAKNNGSDRNLLNHYDRGRLVQQSYYGNADGTFWAGKPWNWNPVQGGDYKGGSARVLELKTGTNRLYAKTMPRHWSGCVELPEVILEEWISLSNQLAHVRFKFTYTGTNSHRARHQEIPAFFAEPDLDTLVLYDGDKPWTGGPLHRSRPGWPNESRRMTEQWAAYVGTNDFGVGAFVPVASQLTCYRYGQGGSNQGACSYFAPLTTFAITPGLVFEYDLYLTLGSATQIRETFGGLQKNRRPPLPEKREGARAD